MSALTTMGSHSGHDLLVSSQILRLRGLIKQAPTDISNRIRLAEIYARQSMTDQAVAELSEAVNLLRAEERIEEFVITAERLVFLQPSNLPLLKELAVIYLRKNDLRRAQQKLHQAYIENRKNEETLELLSQVLERQGRVRDAISVLRELTAVHQQANEENKRRLVERRILDLGLAEIDDPQEGIEGIEEIEVPSLCSVVDGESLEEADLFIEQRCRERLGRR
jgi:cytochrome c-type biogenesis protein CcmH/NrfG